MSRDFEITLSLWALNDRMAPASPLRGPLTLQCRRDDDGYITVLGPFNAEMVYGALDWDDLVAKVKADEHRIIAHTYTGEG